MIKDKPISHLKLIFIFLRYKWQNKKIVAINKSIKIIIKKLTLKLAIKTPKRKKVAE